MPDRVAETHATRNGSGCHYEDTRMATLEPELPGIPAQPPPPKPQWADRLSALFTRKKVPGWVFVIWTIFLAVPDWKSRLDFWLDAAEAAGGYTGEAAAVIGSPYFSIALAVTGVLWLWFVGEPKRGVLRDPRWAYLGWAAVSIVAMGLVVTITNGYVEVRAREISEGRDNTIINDLRDQLYDANLRTAQIEKDIEKQKIALRTWRLTPEEKKALARELLAVPMPERFTVPMICLPDSASRIFTTDVAKIFLDQEWKVDINCLFNNLRPDLLGMHITIQKGIDRKELAPAQAQKISDILTSAGIDFGWAYNDDFKEGQFAISIRNTPAPKSQ